jgi:hypothetical protein
MLCNCATTGECATISPTQCCISNQNTAGDLTPGTCYDSNLWLQTHPMATGFFTEWCRCETSQQCANLFPTLVAQGLCCVSDRMVCDAPRTGETCR